MKRLILWDGKASYIRRKIWSQRRRNPDFNLENPVGAPYWLLPEVVEYKGRKWRWREISSSHAGVADGRRLFTSTGIVLEEVSES